MTDTAELAARCEVCKAKPNEKCRNTLDPDAPLPGREFHDGRIERRAAQNLTTEETESRRNDGRY